MEEKENWRQRIYKENDVKAYETVKNYLEDNDARSSDQAIGLFAVRVAAAKIKAHKAREIELNNNLP